MKTLFGVHAQVSFVFFNGRGSGTRFALLLLLQPPLLLISVLDGVGPEGFELVAHWPFLHSSLHLPAMRLTNSLNPDQWIVRWHAVCGGARIATFFASVRGDEIETYRAAGSAAITLCR